MMSFSFWRPIKAPFQIEKDKWRDALTNPPYTFHHIRDPDAKDHLKSKQRLILGKIKFYNGEPYKAAIIHAQLQDLSTLILLYSQLSTLTNAYYVQDEFKKTILNEVGAIKSKLRPYPVAEEERQAIRQTIHDLESSVRTQHQTFYLHRIQGLRQ